MTALDVRARKLALRMINKYGRRVVLVHKGAPVEDDDTNTTTTPTTEYPFKAVEEAPSKKDIEAGVHVESTMLNIAALALPVGVLPMPQDTIQDGAKLWTVGRVFNESSGEMDALYRVEVKK